MKRYILFSLITLLLFASPLLGFQEDIKIPANIEELKEEIVKILKENNTPGVGLALISKDEIIWSGSLGKMDVAANKDATAETIFRCGSISKSFVSVAVMMLVEKGLVNLSDKVKDLVPDIEYNNPWEDTHPLRLVNVLEHTTGFDDLHINEYAKVDNPTISTFDGLAFNPKSRKSRWQPNMFMSYCNSGPPIGAVVVERITGMTFEDFVDENILAPLGMKTASYFYPKEKHLMSKGYEADGLTEANYDHIIVRPSGSFNSSSTELSYLVQMLMNRGTFNGVKLLEPSSVDRIEVPKSTLFARKGFPYGYGLGNYSTFSDGFIFHGHDGGITGFLARYAYLPEQGLGYIVQVNQGNGKSFMEIAKIMEKYLTADIEKPVPPPAYSLSEDDLHQFTGYFQSNTPRMQLMYFYERFMAISRITLEKGKLYQKPLMGGEKEELIPVSNNTFRRENDADASIIFANDDDGQLYMQGTTDIVKKVSGAYLFIQFAIVILSIILMISSILFALVWIPRKILGKMRDVKYLRARLYPLLAISCIILTVATFMLSSDMMNDFGYPTIFSYSIFIFMLGYGIFSILGLISGIRSYSIKMNRVVRMHSMLVSIANTTATLYLLYWGIIGLRTWSY